MKKIALTIAMTFGALTAFAQEAAGTSDNADTNTPEALPTAQCKPCPKGMQCDGTAWVDIEAITIEAENGDPIAQYAIAYITDNGLGGTTKDPEKADGLYKKALPGLQKAAEKGHPIACRALCRMYAEGKGVDKDAAKAEQFMKQCKECCKTHGGMKGWRKHHGCHGCTPAGCTKSGKPADSDEFSTSGNM